MAGAINGLLFLTAFFVFLVGMVGLNFYNSSKVSSRVSRMNFVTFVGYVLGLGTVLFYVGTNMPAGLSASFILKALSIMSLLTWTMCAMILSDMKKDGETKSKSYTFTAWMLGIMLLLWIGFTFVGFFTTIGPMIDMAEGRMNTAGMGGGMMMPAGMGGMMPAGMGGMMPAGMGGMQQFGKRLNHPLLY